MIDIDPTTITRDTLLDFLYEHAPRWDTTDISDWQVQGFGMLRMYLGENDRYRLQIWDMRLNTWGVSSIHDHPWDFTSTIICGTLWNQRYIMPEGQGSTNEATTPAWRSRLVPGPSGGTVGEPERCHIGARPLEMYSAGEVYSQTWDELHRTRFDQGTVTLLDRDRTSPHGDEAWSVWEVATNLPWVDAKPRPATAQEVRAGIKLVAERWFP